jgi:hypothetical protein
MGRKPIRGKKDTVAMLETFQEKLLEMLPDHKTTSLTN